MGVDHHTWPHFLWAVGSVLILGSLCGFFATWKRSKIWLFVALLNLALFILFVATGDNF